MIHNRPVDEVEEDTLDALSEWFADKIEQAERDLEEER